MIEYVHDAGYIYNDLKLDNILVGYNDKVSSLKDDGKKLSDLIDAR